MSRDGHLLLLCDVTAPASACSTVACMYHVYRDVAWQRIDQISHNTMVLHTTKKTFLYVNTGQCKNTSRQIQMNVKKIKYLIMAS
jgi:hypothetical protein